MPTFFWYRYLLFFFQHLIRPLLLLGLLFSVKCREWVLVFLQVCWPYEEELLVAEDGELPSPHGGRVCEAAAFSTAGVLFPGGPFLFSIAVRFLHPVIVGNEVGNTNRSVLFISIFNVYAGTRAPVSLRVADTFRIASFIYPSRQDRNCV